MLILGEMYEGNLMLTLEAQQWGKFQANTRSTVEKCNIGEVALGQNYTVIVKAGSQASSAMQNLGADLEFVPGPTCTT